jgi:hypothetical protein
MSSRLFLGYPRRYICFRVYNYNIHEAMLFKRDFVFTLVNLACLALPSLQQACASS